MKIHLRRLALQFLFLWFFLGICPLAARFFFAGRTPAPLPESTALPSPSTAPLPTAPSARTFQIYDESTGNMLTLSEEAFLPLAVLCEMSPDAPEEALKAQAVAIRSTARYESLHNSGNGADFSCRTDTLHVYAPAEQLEALYGTEWPGILDRVTALCRETEDLCLYHDGELVSAPFFAISAGCTQSAAAVWPETAPSWLTAVPCPTDLLRPDYLATATLTPEEIRQAFPEIAFTDTPENWFSALTDNESGYTDIVDLCGTVLSGTAVQAAFSLRSAAFSVHFDGNGFQFTTRGSGHGVGMSQAGAMYLAETGADYKTILTYFYPNAQLTADVPIN